MIVVSRCPRVALQFQTPNSEVKQELILELEAKKKTFI
jgi:hypothetical protein